MVFALVISCIRLNTSNYYGYVELLMWLLKRERDVDLKWIFMI